MRVLPGLYLKNCDDDNLVINIRILSASTVMINGLFSKAVNQLKAVGEELSLADKVINMGNTAGTLDDTLEASQACGNTPEYIAQGDQLVQNSLTVNPFLSDEDSLFTVPHDYYLDHISFTPTITFDVNQTGLSWVLDCIGFGFAAYYKRQPITAIPKGDYKTSKPIFGGQWTARLPLRRSNDNITVFMVYESEGDTWIYVAPDMIERLWGTVVNKPPEHIYYHLAEYSPRTRFYEMGREIWGFKASDFLNHEVSLPYNTDGLNGESNPSAGYMRLSLPYTTCSNIPGMDSGIDLYPISAPRKSVQTNVPPLIAIILIDNLAIRDWYK